MEEPESLREFVAARGAALSRTAYLLTGGHDQAQDLLQSALAVGDVRGFVIVKAEVLICPKRCGRVRERSQSSERLSIP
jgi:hypothetical protein